MKLLSCYIEGYGKIRQREFFFEEGITSLLWENGEGKSTLASFLKAMLYGLKGYGKRSTEFCDREHFYPFDGGRFGGNLLLEANGKRYKIERFFGEKSETADSLTVYEDGREMNAPPVDIGRVLLGMDKESFERTAFLRHEDLEIASTSGIHARLNNFLEGVEEEGGLDKALKAIDDAAKRYKKRGGGDLMTEEKKRVEDLKAQIENASQVKASLEENYAQAKEIEQALAKLQSSILFAQTQRERASQFEHYDSIVEEVEKAKAEVTALEKKYPFGVPTLEETKAFNAYTVSSNELQIKMDGARLTQKEEGELRAFEARFQEGVPTKAALSTIEKKIDELKSLQGNSTPRIRSQREEELLSRFAYQRPSQKALSVAEENLTAYRQKKKELETSALFKQNKKFSAKRYALIALVAVAATILGALFLVAGNTLAGGALIAVGVVVTLADGFLYLNKKSAVGSVENPLRASIERETENLARELQSLLLPFGYGGEEGIEVGFARLKRDLEDLGSLETARKAEEEALAKNREKTAKIEGDLSLFFGRYGGEGEGYFQKLSILQMAIGGYETLLKRRKDSAQACEKANEERGAILEKMRAYQEKYGLLRVNAEEILEDARRLERALTAIEEGEERAQAFKREKGLEERLEGAPSNLEELQTEQTRLQSEKERLRRVIEEDERTAELLEGYEAEKKEAEERLKAYKHKHKLLEGAAELLSVASGRLRDKYVKPVKDEFLKYAEVIEKALGERVVMTKDFELRFERNGVERSEKHLSSGQRGVCALCFRLALIKNMYEGQLPFLVLDDPFVTLDEGHIAKVRGVLQALSKEMQMVYLTCHTSRKI